MRHPHDYLLDDAGAISSARLNLKNVIYGFTREAVVARLGHRRNYGYWVHLEVFWGWFRKFNRGGWLEKEKLLQSVVEEVTLAHYPEMEPQEIEEEVKRVLVSFLFERGEMSVVETEKLERFSNYLTSLLTALG